MKHFYLILFLYFLLSSCHTGQNPTDSQIFEKKKMIVSDTSDGWGGDITLSIIKNQKREDGGHIITALSLYNGLDVGFKLSLSPKKKNDNGFYETGISIQSIGQPSDNLLQALAKIYNIKIDPSLKFIDSINAPFVNLDELAETIGDVEKTSDVNTKLFFEDATNENNNGEIFLDFNEKEGWVILKEKDIDYRQAVIKAFSKK